MKKFLFLLFMSALAYSLSAQDVIYTVTGKINDQTTPIDSILVENISNNTRILFGNLPDLPDYNINLTQKTFWGATGIKKFGANQGFLVKHNTPGMLVLAYNENRDVPTSLTIFNASGQKIYGFKNRSLSKGQAVNIHLGQPGLFIIKIISPLGVQAFKAMGSPYPKARPVCVNITGQLAAVQGFKATKAALDDGFSFSLGDSLRFTGYNSKYFAAPISFKVSGSGSLVFNFKGEKGTFTDPRDSTTYKTIRIGTQTWMAENLAYLPSVDSSSNGSETDSYYYVYGYNGTSVSEAKATDNYTTYGVLYNWPAAKAACPSGWHLPTDEEWKTLEMYLGMSQSQADDFNYRGTDEGKKLKSTSGWYDGGNGTDEVGFSALPGGYRNSNGNVYDLVGSYGMWWSTAVIGTAVAWNRALSYGIDKVFRNLDNQAYGYSVRCVRDTTTISKPAAAFTADTTSGTAPLTVKFTDQSTNIPTSWSWDFGDDSTSTEQNPTHTYQKAGIYTVILTVTNNQGSDTLTKADYITVSSGITTGTFTDSRDGKTYKTVKIGTQTWMAENLAYLPGVDSSSNGSETDSSYYVYGYNGTSVSEAKATDNYTTYGVLYNWPAAKAACPSGWHLPTDEEWKILEMYLGMSQSQADGTGFRGTDEGKKLKSTSGWYNGGNGTDEVGFSALPGGYRYISGDFFYNLGYNGLWWSATADGSTNAWSRGLYDGSYEGYRSSKDWKDGFSVRCVRDSDSSK